MPSDNGVLYSSVAVGKDEGSAVPPAIKSHPLLNRLVVNCRRSTMREPAIIHDWFLIE
jgi:hypothetical protein